MGQALPFKRYAKVWKLSLIHICVAQSEIKKIIRQLKKKEIRVFDVPEEYKNDIQLVTFERKAGFRITGKRGFDIISNSFFVEETLIYLDRCV